ncbi:hypothetical protein F4808DRAFT_191348 [Astrocystis sublimbata]|nr:hypothetical protein F4808DRAFT_191348 [Astrocystis sublimbata]
MPLGVRSPWRARSGVGLVQRLSLVPRASLNLLSARRLLPAPRCWLSSAQPSAQPSAQSPPTELRDPAEQLERSVARTTLTSPSPTSPLLKRRPLRRLIKKQTPPSYDSVLVKQPIRHRDRLASRSSLSKHVKSARKQVVNDVIRNALDRQPNDWRSTLDLMIRHTPKFGEILDFKVGIGRAAAAQARESFSELDTNLWQIQQKHQCKIHIDVGLEKDEPLILSLSGTIVSVRDSLLELVRVVGRVLAIRVLDPTLQLSPPEFWKGGGQGQLPIKLLGDGDSAPEDDTVTVYGHHTTDFVKLAQPRRHKLYKLTTRADEIPQPTVWTKLSFEQHVARLVFAQVPTHLHKSLYLTGMDHQSTVVSLLTWLFTSEDLRAYVSLAALKLALRFIHARGRAFRHAAYAIFYKAQLHHLPLDAQSFQAYLVSTSKDGDLDGFNSVLRAMLRRGHYVRGEHWTAFLSMIQDPRAKSYAMRRMTLSHLHNTRPILEEMGRQNMLMELEHNAGPEMNIKHLLRAQNRQYGQTWLDTITFNKMIDMLGSRGYSSVCHELLDCAGLHQRARPDQYTLNTMMTHTRSIQQKITLLSRWPGLEPDGFTYQSLFSVAWRQRLPNMLRVIWRYAAFAGLTSSNMRHSLTVLMKPEQELSKQRAFLKAWEDVIFGGRELAASKWLNSDGSQGFGAASLLGIYAKEANNMRPSVRLEVKLLEAYELDMKIHKLNKEGTEFSPSMKENLTIDIPLVPRVVENPSGELKSRI